LGRAVVGCVLLATSFIFAQNIGRPKYKVVKGWPPAKAVEPMNAAADQGYRVLFTGRLAVMRLDTAPPDTYRYQVIPDENRRANMLNALNQQGALGYAWLKDTPMLEKAPYPRNYEYEVVTGFTTKSRDRAYDAALEQGFQLMAERPSGLIMMREVGNVHPAEHQKPIRIADALRMGNLMKDITKLAAQGYRYRSHEASQKGGGKAVAMEACDSECGGPFEYRSFDVNDAAQLERDLNLLGTEGFRVVPQSLGWEPYLAERPAKHTQTFLYRVVEAQDESTAEKGLNAGDRDGFVPLNFAAHVGWNVHVFVVMEKVTAAAAQ
jgi:hypothetical protein